jgi:DNA processing protein
MTAAPPAAAAATRDLAVRVALHRVHRLGAVRFAILERGFPSIVDAWGASRGELVAAGLDDRSAAALVAARATIDPDAELERLERAGVRALPRADPDYPSRLREIDDAPPLLYARGAWTGDDDWSVAIVGTRRATAYGRQAAAEFARGLAANRVTVVSGLARGIDTLAHRAALDAGGRTVAVFASGLDTVYPPENRRLAEEIAERGALLTDYPLGTRPRAEFFPRRNRILSGLSLGTLVVEGDHTSGAMITAKCSLEQGREVFAVPGSIFSTGVSDLLEALNLTMIGAQLDFGQVAPLANDAERALMAALSREPRHVDDLARRSGLAAATVSSTLAMLELKGAVRAVGGMQYVRVREEPADYGGRAPARRAGTRK